MKNFACSLTCFIAVTHLVMPAFAAPVIPGLAGKHPLSEAEVGQLLIGELKCTACHGEKKPDSRLDRAAPDLSEVGTRVAPDYLKKFIASPESAHPGSMMPDALAMEPAAERAKIAEAITHFLVSQTQKPFARTRVDVKEAATGKSLFHTVGCVTCHAPHDEKGKEILREGAISLAHAPAKYSVTSLAAFLFQPHRVRPSGRMPDMKLTPVESKAIACYLMGSADAKPTTFTVDEKLAALGKQHYQQLNCAACHKLGDIPAAPMVVALEKADLNRGCLTKTPGKGPRFTLSEGQTKAIRTALTAKAPITDKALVAQTLTAFNCIGCHSRDGYGGVPEETNSFFTSSEKELGDDGRIPPPLTLVGAKLQMVALKKVLFDGDGVRPYMATRMPQYGEPNLRHLPDLFAKLDKVKPVVFNLPKAEGTGARDREREKEMRAAGRELVGDKGLGCIACHAFNGKAPNKKCVDLMTTTQRLQPSWTYHFLQDPNAFRPRVVMPTSWPNGQAMHKKILNGDTDRQLEAIWYYLTLGTSAADPSGIQRTDTILSAKDGPRLHRGRSNVAGFRGIAVGFPEKLNYAFNAETGTLSAIWKGDFVRVNWSGQGSGNFTPATRHIQLAQDVSFHDLPDENAAWPLLPVMTKESPENPNPLYPKNLGYQFKGYYTDDADVPTFMYRTGETKVEDRSVPRKEGKLLDRTLTFDSPAERTVWFRALTGKIEAESKMSFKIGGLRIMVPAVPTLVRPIADAKSSELLLKLVIPKGKSTQSITYEILP